jgi:hypothetical protein
MKYVSRYWYRRDLEEREIFLLIIIFPLLMLLIQGNNYSELCTTTHLTHICIKLPNGKT